MSTILCIDDDPRILELEKAILEANGYAVLVAGDGLSGISIASQQPVDLVVLDFKMPDMDGDQVAEAILKQRPELPVVICTGFFDAVPEWLRWFADGYVQKGDGPAVLLSTIRQAIAAKAPAQAVGRDLPRRDAA